MRLSNSFCTSYLMAATVIFETSFTISLAANIQQALFPEKIPEIEGYDIAAFNRPARACGGDYYDVLEVNKNDPNQNGSYLFCVADIAGKGLPAALLMSHMQAA